MNRSVYTLAAEADPPKVDRVPKISLLIEDNVRRGFFEPHEYQIMHQELPE